MPPHAVHSNGGLGVFLQVKAGSIFDNILITDEIEYAKEAAEETWGKNKDVSYLILLYLISNMHFMHNDLPF